MRSEEAAALLLHFAKMNSSDHQLQNRRETCQSLSTFHKDNMHDDEEDNSQRRMGSTALALPKPRDVGGRRCAFQNLPDAQNAIYSNMSSRRFITFMDDLISRKTKVPSDGDRIVHWQRKPMSSHLSIELTCSSGGHRCAFQNFPDMHNVIHSNMSSG